MIYFNPTDPRCKSPVGATAEGEPTAFTLRCPRRAGVYKARMLVEADSFNKDANAIVYDMQWAGFESNCDIYTVTINSPAQGLYYYSFETHCLRKQSEKLTHVREEIHHQWLTTRPDDTICGFIKGGIIYHIFVDRFHKSSLSKDGSCKSNPSKNNAIQREDWGGIPIWRANEKGIVENRDFFGGDLEGIRQKLPYLHSLGVSSLYLSPIFEARSNHKYDTGDYHKIDPMFGTEDDFKILCEEAKKLNIKIILDGVFNHTGDDSIYFNKYGNYSETGAYQSTKSPYYEWYNFTKHPNDYDCWWGIKILPSIKREATTFIPFITGENGVISHWMRAGAAGFRLDVADELSNGMLEAIHKAVKKEDPNGYVLAEVWEDASNKIAYGERRKYLQGGQCDGVMNYPLRRAILEYLRQGDAAVLAKTMDMLTDHYPPATLNACMTPLSTHDTARLLTVLGDPIAEQLPREQQAEFKLNEAQLEKAKKLAKLAVILQYTLPGVPSVYYGEEAGMQGCADPFNRRCYPWGGEDLEMLHFYRKMGKIRRNNTVFAEGIYKLLAADKGLFVFERTSSATAQDVIVAVNAADAPANIEYGGIITLGSYEGAVLHCNHKQ